MKPLKIYQARINWFGLTGVLPLSFAALILLPFALAKTGDLPLFFSFSFKITFFCIIFFIAGALKLIGHPITRVTIYEEALNLTLKGNIKRKIFFNNKGNKATVYKTFGSISGFDEQGNKTTFNLKTNDFGNSKNYKEALNLIESLILRS